MRAPFRGLTCLIAILATVPTPAQEVFANPTTDAAASEHFAAGNSAFERKDFARAREAFRAAIAAGSAGPAAYYNAAVAEYRLGDYAAAATSFRELGRQFPQFGALADYNLGLALYRQDQQESAREAFLRAARADEPEIAALAQAMLDRMPGPPIAAPRRWLRLLEAGLGQDDNVVLADPLGLPAGRSAESGFFEIAFYAGGPVSRNDAWSLAGNVYLLDYGDAPEYDQSALQLAAARESRAGRWSLAAGPRIGRSTIGGDGFEQYLGAALEIGRPIPGAGARFELVLSFDTTEAIESQFAYIEGERSAVSLRFDKALARATLIFDYRYSADDRAGSGVSADHNRYRAIWRRPWGRLWTSDLIVEWRDTEYGQLQPVREENRLQSGLRAQRRIGADWQLNLRYGYTDNDSSDPRYSYERNLVAVGASLTF